MSPTEHAYTFKRGTSATSTVLVLFHGSHGAESDLAPLALELAPGATTLAVRGAITMDVGHCFFRRLADRRVDEADLEIRTAALAEFLTAKFDEYELNNRPIAIGFSNGAIMTASLLMTRPGLFAGAILIRSRLPFTQAPQPQRDVERLPVLILDGATDPRRSPGDGLRVADRFRDLGADVTHQVLPVGHSITDEDTRIAHAWLAKHWP